MPSPSSDFRIVAPRIDRWPDLVDLFGAGGPCSRCWCMYWRIGPGYRKYPLANQATLLAVSAALVDAAIQAARRARARVLEAYPLDATRTRSANFTGFLTTFLHAGFTIVARHSAAQPVVRLDLRKSR